MHNGLNLQESVSMNKRQDLIDAVLEQSQKNGRRKELPCAEAFELARKFNARLTAIGRICNQNNVRIRKCQLGCFA